MTNDDAGPVSFYMSKAPAGVSLSSYDGSGDWFKIKDIGPTFPSSCSASWDLSQSYTVTIPKSLPNGNYLLRAQQLAIHNPYPGGIPQFYIVSGTPSIDKVLDGLIMLTA